MWLPCHTDELNKMKNLLTTAPVLASFDESLDVTIQYDASKDDLSCCVLQKGRPVCFSSFRLTDSEGNYSHSRKRFACNRYFI